jgi:hypothetical protein
VQLYAETGSPKAEPTAVRWLARLALERPRTTLGELQLAAAALDQIAERPKAAPRLLLELASQAEGSPKILLDLGKVVGRKHPAVEVVLAQSLSNFRPNESRSEEQDEAD